MRSRMRRGTVKRMAISSTKASKASAGSRSPSMYSSAGDCSSADEQDGVAGQLPRAGQLVDRRQPLPHHVAAASPTSSR